MLSIKDKINVSEFAQKKEKHSMVCIKPLDEEEEE